MIAFAVTAAPGGEISLWHLFMQASWVVKLVMLGLVLASVWSWAIIIEKFFAVRKMNSANDRFEQYFWSGQSLEDLFLSMGNRNNIGLAAIFMAAMREWKRSQDAAMRAGFQGVQKRIEKVMDVQIQKEMHDVEVAPAVPRHHGVGRALHRPVRHGVGHHGVVPGHRQFAEHQPQRGGAGHRGSAVRHRHRPCCRHTGDNLLQHVLLRRGEDRRTAREFRG